MATTTISKVVEKQNKDLPTLLTALGAELAELQSLGWQLPTYFISTNIFSYDSNWRKYSARVHLHKQIKVDDKTGLPICEV